MKRLSEDLKKTKDEIERLKKKRDKDQAALENEVERIKSEALIN